ncbi:hypothetical protein WJX72_010682 [[Myrmecia] bisecta]|uniref:Uncharacterized protein n=1 Tax=[Myrmecia] bisecta TaxID=41462 RepID=A0AAW1QT72_9CHLO
MASGDCTRGNELVAKSSDQTQAQATVLHPASLPADAAGRIPELAAAALPLSVERLDLDVPECWSPLEHLQSLQSPPSQLWLDLQWQPAVDPPGHSSAPPQDLQALTLQPTRAEQQGDRAAAPSATLHTAPAATTDAVCAEDAPVEQEAEDIRAEQESLPQQDNKASRNATTQEAEGSKGLHEETSAEQEGVKGEAPAVAPALTVLEHHAGDPATGASAAAAASIEPGSETGQANLDGTGLPQGSGFEQRVSSAGGGPSALDLLAEYDSPLKGVRRPLEIPSSPMQAAARTHNIPLLQSFPTMPTIHAAPPRRSPSPGPSSGQAPPSPAEGEESWGLALNAERPPFSDGFRVKHARLAAQRQQILSDAPSGFTPMTAPFSVNPNPDEDLLLELARLVEEEESLEAMASFMAEWHRGRAHYDPEDKTFAGFVERQGWQNDGGNLRLLASLRLIPAALSTQLGAYDEDDELLGPLRRGECCQQLLKHLKDKMESPDYRSSLDCSGLPLADGMGLFFGDQRDGEGLCIRAQSANDYLRAEVAGLQPVLASALGPFCQTVEPDWLSGRYSKVERESYTARNHMLERFGSARLVLSCVVGAPKAVRLAKALDLSGCQPVPVGRGAAKGTIKEIELMCTPVMFSREPVLFTELVDTLRGRLIAAELVCDSEFAACVKKDPAKYGSSALALLLQGAFEARLLGDDQLEVPPMLLEGTRYCVARNDPVPSFLDRYIVRTNDKQDQVPPDVMIRAFNVHLATLNLDPLPDAPTAAGKKLVELLSKAPLPELERTEHKNNHGRSWICVKLKQRRKRKALTCQPARCN